MEAKIEGLEFAIQVAFARERSAFDYYAEVAQHVDLIEKLISRTENTDEKILAEYNSLRDDLQNARAYYENIRGERLHLEEELHNLETRL